MKAGKRRLLCGWLTFCLLLGLVSAGLAEDEGIVVELSNAAEAGDGAVDVELDIGRTNDAPDGGLVDLTLDDSEILLDLPDINEDIASADGLADLEALGSVSTLANASDSEDFEIDENGVLVQYKGAGGDVVIPDGVTSIGQNAFCGCYDLTSVTIPKSVTSIGEGAFYDCISLTSVTIPDSVTSIGEGAFYRCSLESVTIPNSVTSIGDYAFGDCDNLTSVTIPDSVTSIETIAFGSCDKLEAINVSKGNPNYASKDGILYTRDLKTLVQCPGAKISVTIPNGVTSIGEGAFEDCSSLTSVTIPNSVTSIGNWAFYKCSSLTSVTIPDSVTSIGEGVFCNCSSLTSVTIPNSVTSIGYKAFGCTSLTSVTIPDSVTSIGEGAFYECTSLTSVTIPNSVTYIGVEAFSYCISLTSVTIPNSVTSIGCWAFCGCSSLESVIIPEGATKIWEGTFCGCISLKKITIPKSVTYIGAGAFAEDGEEFDGDDYFYGTINITIYGYAGSYAETYAKENGIPFVSIDDGISLAKAKVTVASQVYTGKAIKPAVKVVLNGKTLKKGTDYTVSYKNNKAIGTATATVKGKGKYKGSASASFKINPKAVKGLKLKSGQNSLSVSWTKSAGISGYQLQYGTKKNFTSSKKITISKASTVSKAIKNLKKGKTYYVRIRAYKKVSGKIYYSAWSGAKKAKVM